MPASPPRSGPTPWSIRTSFPQTVGDCINPALTEFDASCFDGCYITGDVDEHYLDAVENRRGGGRSGKSDEDGDGKASPATGPPTGGRSPGLMIDPKDYRPKPWPFAPARNAASSTIFRALYLDPPASFQSAAEAARRFSPARSRATSMPASSTPR